MKGRRTYIRALACAALLLAASRTWSEEPAEPAPPTGFSVHGWATSWTLSDGLYYGVDVPDLPATWETGDLQWRPFLRGQFGIRLGVDAEGVRQDGRWVDLDNDVGVRRGYFYADGRIQGLWAPISYKLEVGAVQDRFSLRNASIAIHEIPYVGTLRLGTFDAPMSLSLLTSSRATPLMEIGLPVNALAPGTLSGFSVTNRLERERVGWSFGFFSKGDAAEVGDESNVPARFLGRLTWLPWRTPGGLLHLGASASWAFSPTDIRYASHPEAFFAPNVVDTGRIDAGQSVTLGLESAWVRDRLSVQGEWLQSLVMRDKGGDLTFGGFYVLASWFLTPDSRHYDDADGAFGSVVPTRPVSWTARTIGAWELAARWSWLDLSDRDVRGGRASEVMSGINWYANRWVRLQANVGWLHADRGTLEGDAAVLESRIDLMF